MRWFALLFVVLAACAGSEMTGNGPPDGPDAAAVADASAPGLAAGADIVAVAPDFAAPDVAEAPDLFLPPDLARACQPQMAFGQCGCPGMPCCNSKGSVFCLNNIDDNPAMTCFADKNGGVCHLCGALDQSCCGSHTDLAKETCSPGLRCVRIRNGQLHEPGAYACRPDCGRDGLPCCKLDPHCDPGLTCRSGDGGMPYPIESGTCAR